MRVALADMCTAQWVRTCSVRHRGLSPAELAARLRRDGAAEHARAALAADERVGWQLGRARERRCQQQQDGRRASTWGASHALRAQRYNGFRLHTSRFAAAP